MDGNTHNSGETRAIDNIDKEIINVAGKSKEDKVRKKDAQTTLLAKKLQKDKFFKIWELYKAKENTDKLTKANIAAHFFFLGAKSAFILGMKDYDTIKDDNKESKIKEMQTKRKFSEIKKNALKIRNEGGLNIDGTVAFLRNAIEENKNNPELKARLEKEISFLLDYKLKKLASKV